MSVFVIITTFFLIGEPTYKIVPMDSIIECELYARQHSFMPVPGNKILAIEYECILDGYIDDK